MRVLLVAPRTDLLLVDEEVQDILSSGLQVTPMLGNVTQAELVRALRRESYDLLWLATHGSAKGIVLSDGTLSPSALAAVVRNRVGAVFLNSCESVMVAQHVQNETDAELVATIVPVPDDDAYRTGSLFADWLSRTNDIYTAYRHSRPGGNRLYVYLGHGQTVMESQPEQVDLLTDKVTRIERILDGDGDLGIRGMRAELHGLRQDMDLLLKRTEPTEYRLPLYLVVVTITLAASSLLIVEVRQLLGMQPMAAFIVIVLLGSIGAVLFATVLKIGWKFRR
jgi:hypothetical protein